MLRVIFLSLAGLVCLSSGQTNHCQHDCSNYNGHEVCGSDHQTYASLCEFSIAACLEHEYHNGHLRVVHRGACSGTHSSTVVNNHCNDLCNEDKDYVCASDGKVYDNKCTFLRAQCEAQKMNMTLIPVVTGDSCPQRTTPDCSKYSIDLSDIAIEGSATFQPKCPTARDYLCASDGHTYPSECVLCSYMETHQVKLDILNNAPCLH